MNRSICACNQCVACCKAMPGYLIPGDLERIAAFTRQTDIATFAADHFCASEGALVRKFDGTQFRIPTIVPQQRENGHCVFLDENDRCTIHSVSPFGCAYFTPHESDEEAEPKSRHGLVQILQRPDEYNIVHRWLKEQGKVAAPLQERKSQLLELLNS